MMSMKLIAAYSDPATARRSTSNATGHLLISNSEKTSHLPFAALFIGATDDPQMLESSADVGIYLACERTIKNKPPLALQEDELPGIVGIFPMVANADLGVQASDEHWRDRHAPLALEIHTTMTHYYQMAVMHRFSGPQWNGFALCCCASEDDLRHHFYKDKDGVRRIAEDVATFADTRKSPRRVIADMSIV